MAETTLRGDSGGERGCEPRREEEQAASSADVGRLAQDAITVRELEQRQRVLRRLLVAGDRRWVRSRAGRPGSRPDTALAPRALPRRDPLSPERPSSAEGVRRRGPGTGRGSCHGPQG